MTPPSHGQHDMSIMQNDQMPEFIQKLKGEFCLQLINAVNDLVIILDTDRRILFANKNAMSMFQTTCEDIAERRIGEMLGCIHSTLHPDGCGATRFCDKCGAFHTIKKALTGACSKEECRILRKNGNIYEALDFLVSTTPICIGETSILVVALTDISSEKRRRVLERTFFHDVLNTAGGVCGLTEYLVDVAPPQIHPDLLVIHEALNDLVEEINAQKELIAAEDSDLSLQFSSISPSTLLDYAKKTYERHPVAEGKHIICDNACTACIIESDEPLLRRIMGNMVKNALEASSLGDSIVVGCRTEPQHAIFFVNNPNVMSEDVQLQVFKRSFTTKGSGRGLGTYAIKLFTESYLGGTAWFTSEPETGTTFFARIPNKLSENHTA